MCHCNPQIRTPWCNSSVCQEQLKTYVVDKDGIYNADQEFRDKYLELKWNADESKNKLKAHVDTCTHPKVYLKKVAGSNTGNWCASDDCYWDTCDCSLCGSHWTEYK